MVSKRSCIVLVHGGFLGAWSWTDVVADLEGRGFIAVAPELPSMGVAPLGDLHDDAAAVRSVLDDVTAPVLLCGHSYGGAVITEAAAGPHPAVHRLVYLAGAVPDVGQSMADLVSPTSAGPESEHGVEQVTARSDGSIVLTRAAAAAALFHDCPPERAQAALDQLRPMNPAVGAQPVTGAAWRDLPATLVRCSADKMPELVCAQFLRHNPEVVYLPSGHCPNWSAPGLVGELLAARIEQVSG